MGKGSNDEPRSGSVAARAAERHGISVACLLVLPLLLLAAMSRECDVTLPLVVADAAILCVLWMWDVGTLVSTAWAARRKCRGLAPPEQPIDYGFGAETWSRVVRARDPYRERDRVELVALGHPARAASFIAGKLAWRAVGLGLVVTFPLAALPLPRERGFVSPTHTALSALRAATIFYRNTHPNVCPSVRDLKRERILDDDFRPFDEWGRTMWITCEGDEIFAHSCGPDRRPATSDDLDVPPSDLPMSSPRK
jgi:hypothetical protein